MFLGVWIWMSENGNQAFVIGIIAKINFHENRISHDSIAPVSWFRMALGLISMACVALDTGLKFDDLSGWFGGRPRSWQCAWRLVNPRALVDNNSRIPGTGSRDSETETGSLETEKEAHRIHDTLETGSKPCGPVTEGPADFECSVYCFFERNSLGNPATPQNKKMGAAKMFGNGLTNYSATSVND